MRRRNITFQRVLQFKTFYHALLKIDIRRFNVLDSGGGGVETGEESSIFKTLKMEV